MGQVLDVYWCDIGVIWGYIGIMENKMELLEILLGLILPKITHKGWKQTRTLPNCMVAMGFSDARWFLQLLVLICASMNSVQQGMLQLTN